MLSPHREAVLLIPRLNHRRSIQHKGFSPLAFQTAAHSADLNHVVHERGKYAPIRWLARSPSDAIDELEAYRVGGAPLSSPFLRLLFVGRPTRLLGALAVTAMAAARWMMLVTRWTVERRRRRDKLYFKMVVRIITAAAVDPPARPSVRWVPPPPSPPPPRSMRAEKGS